jgi:hypothetical protein
MCKEIKPVARVLPAGPAERLLAFSQIIFYYTYTYHILSGNTCYAE